MDFKNILPDPNDPSLRKSPELIMRRLMDDIAAKYSGHISATFTSSSQVFEDGASSVLDYTFYLIFLKQDNFSYPLFTATCMMQDGAYPLVIRSHYGPPIDYGKAADGEAFEKIIELIFKEERTRNVILSMY